MARKPAEQTKTHNYLLRSAKTYTLMAIMLRVLKQCVYCNGYGFENRSESGQWLYNCTWEVRQLINHGYLILPACFETGNHQVKITGTGLAMLKGALTALNLWSTLHEVEIVEHAPISQT